MDIKCECCSFPCTSYIAYFDCDTCDWQYKYNYARLLRNIRYEDLLTNYKCECSKKAKRIFNYFTYWCENCKIHYDSSDIESIENKHNNYKKDNPFSQEETTYLNDCLTKINSFYN